MIDLRGKRMVVTGASRGIGAAVVEAGRAAGMRVVGLARSFEEHAAPVTADGAYSTLRVELADPAARRGAVPRATALLGGLDVWVNNAGLVRYGALAEASRADLDALFEVNFRAPLELSQAALPALAVTGGALVNVLSTLALRPAANVGAYAASKAALLSATKTLSLEWAGRRVRVNAVAPGIIDTDMIRLDRAAALGATESREDLEALHLAGRLGTPTEVAEAVLFLAASPWTTGTVLRVDGGLAT